MLGQLVRTIQMCYLYLCLYITKLLPLYIHYFYNDVYDLLNTVGTHPIL